MLKAAPFKPFVICMADGEKLQVDHPEFVALSPTGDEMVVFESDGHFHMVDIMLVTRLAAAKNAPKKTSDK
jgi:hypothetical protein